MRRVAVIGGGWAGLSAAVAATTRGAEVALFEAAPLWGGRARSDTQSGAWLDNGQHILIGAYQRTLALMRQVGAEPDALLHRSPLNLLYPDGSGLRLPGGPPALAFLRGVWAWKALKPLERLRLLSVAAKWRLQGFRCSPSATVQSLCAGVPPKAWTDLLEPLTVAALNTPADQASGQVLLTVLRDALFGPPGSADLLLPKVPLHDLLPGPATAWLVQHGTTLRPGHRVRQLAATAGGWQVDGESFDGVILACPPREASRLVQGHAPQWATQAAAFEYQPIITIWLRAPGARWPSPMLAFRAHTQAPAQFGFALGQLGGPADHFTLVVSGAREWVDQGQQATCDALLHQLRQSFAGQPLVWPRQVDVVAVRAEKRATFACTPTLVRPGRALARGLVAAGDHVLGPYPATLEGAVRSGELAVAALFD